MKIGMEMTGMLQGAGMLGDGAYATNYWDDIVSLPFCFFVFFYPTSTAWR